MLIKKLLPLTAVIGLISCYGVPNPSNPDENKTPAPEAKSLRDIEIPEGFKFETSRPVSLTLSAEQARLSGGYASVEIARGDGGVLYRGPLQAGTPVQLNLSVPTKDQQLKVKVMANNTETIESISIVDGVAQLHLN